MTASYDADGAADVVTYPGGLTATTADDNAGNDIRLTYAKSGTTWMTFAQTESVHGQIRTTAGPTSRQLNSYDAAARLTRVDDLAGTACTRRDYAFDINTNRTGLTTTVGVEATPSPAVLCDLTGKTPSSVSSTYDTADRATATGYTYDNLGRSTAVPAGAVAGGAALTVGYSANDMVNTLTQSGRTKTYTLDPLPPRTLRRPRPVRHQHRHRHPATGEPARRHRQHLRLYRHTVAQLHRDHRIRPPA